jgi:hypothetical protein
MKTYYRVYYIENKEICIPSTDYYSRSGDFHTDYVSLFIPTEEFENKEDAVNFIPKDSNLEYAIIEIYKNK